jgi:hypothetical protein
MRNAVPFLASLLLFPAAHAQYGTFDAATAKAARNATLLVVLDGRGSPYDQAIMNAVKSEWKANAALDFITAADLGTRPIDPAAVYLMKIAKTDPVKFEGTFLAVVQGWKTKKGETLALRDGAFTNVPAERELATLIIDPKAIGEGDPTALLRLYVKHLQDYLRLVESGKVTDKATADRTYAGRTRLVREGELLFAKEHLDKSLPGEEKVKEQYTSPFRIVDRNGLQDALEKQDRSVCVSDVVLTIGDHRNKHCFKRIFNSGTGELMYLRDDQAIFGKKEGFIEEDLKAVERAR